MDISNFMSWWVQQLVRWFTYIFSLLDSITFGGTSLLRVIVTINILIPLIYVLLTIVHNGSIGDSINEVERARANSHHTHLQQQKDMRALREHLASMEDSQ